MAGHNPARHGKMLMLGWERLFDLICNQSTEVVVDGNSLRLAKVVAVARYGTSVNLDQHITHRVRASSEYLTESLANGDCIYGVNTGFGGSADTRTDDTHGLQKSLVEMLQYGILDLPAKPGQLSVAQRTPGLSMFARALPNTDNSSTTTMPEAWVRAAMVVRISSLASGNSGVRPELIHSISNLLRHNIIPVVPLRGSISASGDLSPLSYIAGAIQGSPGVKVWADEAKTGRRTIINAKVALEAASIAPVQLGPKEGLAIVNGTAVSAGVAGLALHDAHCLAVLSQILTAMGVEALRGTDESFSPFIAAVRPHPGQIEAASNISLFLKGSQLTVSHAPDDHSTVDDGSLRQDRYSIRTSSQWLGPQLEDLLLAHEQLSTEINSTTDNPLIDPEGRRIYHGGNFQALAVTSAMEKTRRSLQVIGRMLFAQCTELINPALNNGLSPNLTASEPSKSFLMKGIDIGVAALQAELGFLSGSIVSHVQTAEMSNQSLNSMALVSARYTHTALDVLFQLSSYYLFALCQALDLRAMQDHFLTALKPEFEATTKKMLGSAIGSNNSEHLMKELWPRLQKEMNIRTTLDSAHRIRDAVSALQPLVLENLPKDAPSVLSSLASWTQDITALIIRVHSTARIDYITSPDATPFLSAASARVYRYVRGELGVPMICGDGTQGDYKEGAKSLSEGKMGEVQETLGSLVTKIYKALRDGSGFVPVMDCLKDALREQGEGKVRAKL